MPAADERLPVGLRPPVEVALAKAVNNLPAAKAIPGHLSFEPKFDGYRAVIFRDQDSTSLWSRQGKDLTRYSVGPMRRRAGFWPGESAVVSARQVSLTCLSMSTSLTTSRTACTWLCQVFLAPAGRS